MPRFCSRLLLLAGLALLLGLFGAGCGGQRVTFHYPGESLVFPNQGPQPAVYVEFVNDLRSERQRTAGGSSADVRFPSDENWDRPVAQIYYEALTQDLTQTNALALASGLGEADYVLHVDLLNLGCATKRSSAGWLASSLLGGLVGWALGHNPGAAVVGAVVGIGAVPVPTRLRAICEVRLRLQDLEGSTIWEETCLGEVTDGGWESMTSRKDQEWVDRYLAVAVKRCNACLVGQLRQAAMARESAWGRSR